MDTTAGTLTLEYRTGNAYDALLLIRDGKVCGAWIDGDPRGGDGFAAFLALRSKPLLPLCDWDMYPDEPFTDGPVDPYQWGDWVGTLDAAGEFKIHPERFNGRRAFRKLPRELPDPYMNPDSDENRPCLLCGEMIAPCFRVCPNGSCL